MNRIWMPLVLSITLIGLISVNADETDYSYLYNMSTRQLQELRNAVDEVLREKEASGIENTLRRQISLSMKESDIDPMSSNADYYLNGYINLWMEASNTEEGVLTIHEPIQRDDGGFNLILEDEFFFLVCVETKADRIVNDIIKEAMTELSNDAEITDVAVVRFVSVSDTANKDIFFFDAITDVLTNDGENHIIQVAYALNDDKTDLVFAD